MVLTGDEKQEILDRIEELAEDIHYHSNRLDDIEGDINTAETDATLLRDDLDDLNNKIEGLRDKIEAEEETGTIK